MSKLGKLLKAKLVINKIEKQYNLIFKFTKYSIQTSKKLFGENNNFCLIRVRFLEKKKKNTLIIVTQIHSSSIR